jgi:hypothetical protein
LLLTSLYRLLRLFYQATHPFGYRPFFQKVLFVCVDLSIDTAIAISISQSVETQKVVINILV